MTRGHRIVAHAAVFALICTSVIVAAQQRPNRVSDQQVGDLLRRMFTQAADRLRDGAQHRRAGAAEIEDVLRRASTIDSVMTSNTFAAAVERDWRIVQGRDQLELPRGTELTITSGVPRSQRMSTSPQR